MQYTLPGEWHSKKNPKPFETAFLLLQLVIEVYFYREHFGAKHPKYSDTLLDYGFYLLNVDNICQSVAIYQVCSRTKCVSSVSLDPRSL